MAIAEKKLVHTRYVKRRAERAITARLGYWHAGAIISCDRDPDNQRAVILHVNSGGNAIECAAALKHAGYRIEDTGYDPFAPGHYGVQIRVLAST